MSTIKLTVNDSLEVKPDILKIIISVKAKSKTYEDAMSLGTRKVSAIKNIVTKYDKDLSCMAVKSIQVLPNYINVEKKDKNLFGSTSAVEKRLVNFDYSSGVEIKITPDTEFASKLYADLLMFDSSCRVVFKYNLSNEGREKYEDELLSNLVKKARRKADIVAENSNCVVDKLLCVDKEIRVSTVSFTSYDCDDDFCFCEDDCGDFSSTVQNTVSNMLDLNNIEPVVLRDSLNIEFSIKEK